MFPAELTLSSKLVQDGVLHTFLQLKLSLVLFTADYYCQPSIGYQMRYLAFRSYHRFTPPCTILKHYILSKFGIQFK